ncbi:MAG: glycosyltransferase family 2 protein [Colwellia sp.]|nr:glycosyltransferase family 2 protein [Colwellia sp.]
MTVNITFIIPHKGREEFLTQTVASILSQQYDKTQFEILIVTQNKKLENIDYFQQASVAINVHFQPENQTISALRNYGVTQAKGQYLAFLDADVELSSNWLSCMLTTIQEKSARMLVSAAQVNGPNAPPLEKIRTALSNAELDCNVNFLPGRNLFLSKETFEQVNGFPEHLITCEDYYFTDQVHQLGELYYTSQANYIHLGEDKQYNEMYKKEIWRGQSNLQSIKGRNIPLREIPSFVIPLALFVLFTTCLLALLLNNTLLAIGSFILLLLPITAYSFRLHKLTKNDVSFSNVFKFYLIYFPARAIGTLGGLFKSFSNSGIK